MIQEDKKEENKTTYEVNNKKYTVITRCVENVQNRNELYEVICKYVISQMHICN
mgnify:CR=1 FL=1